MSRRSCDTPGLTGSCPSPCFSGPLVCSAMIQSLFKIGGTQRKQWELRQVPEIQCQPKPAETNGRDDVQPGKIQRYVLHVGEICLDERKHIHHVHHDDVDSNRKDGTRVLLERL